MILTTNATVYNSKGRPTNITLKKGLLEEAYGQVKINGQQFYKIGGNHYILTSTAKISDPNAKLPINDTDHKSKHLYGKKSKIIEFDKDMNLTI